jgi:hypothetical protein
MKKKYLLKLNCILNKFILKINVFLIKQSLEIPSNLSNIYKLHNKLLFCIENKYFSSIS